MKTFIIISIFMLSFLSSFLQAQQTDTLYLWPDKVPGEMKPKQEPVISENSEGDVIRIAEITNPALIIYEPEEMNNCGAGIIVCPGGAYNILAVNKEGYEIAEWLNSLGYTAFVLLYRVPDKREGALNDVQRAIRIIRSKAEKYNIDPEKIGVMGFSAGGSLSARAAIRFNDESYLKLDRIDTYSCRPDFAMLIYPAYLDLGENRSLTPELTPSGRTPPFFIFETADDPYGNSALVMTTALRDFRVPVELHYLPHGGHGYGLRPGKIAAETWPVLAGEWLDRQVCTKE